MKWDITKTPMIKEFSCEFGYCDETGRLKVVEPSTVEAVRTGTRMAVTENPSGTLYRIFNQLYPIPIAVAGKTGTAEYCDDVARKANKCQFGAWPLTPGPWHTLRMMIPRSSSLHLPIMAAKAVRSRPRWWHVSFKPTLNSSPLTSLSNRAAVTLFSVFFFGSMPCYIS